MTNKYQQRKEEILKQALIEFERAWDRDGMPDSDGERSATQWLSTALDQIAKEVAEVAEVEKDEYFYDDDGGEDQNEREDAAELQYETLGEAEAGGYNTAITRSHQHLKDYFSGTDILLEDKEKGI